MDTLHNQVLQWVHHCRRGFEIFTVSNVLSLDSQHIPYASSDDLNNTGHETENLRTAKSIISDTGRQRSYPDNPEQEVNHHNNIISLIRVA